MKKDLICPKIKKLFIYKNFKVQKNSTDSHEPMLPTIV